MVIAVQRISDTCTFERLIEESKKDVNGRLEALAKQLVNEVRGNPNVKGSDLVPRLKERALPILKIEKYIGKLESALNEARRSTPHEETDVGEGPPKDDSDDEPPSPNGSSEAASNSQDTKSSSEALNNLPKVLGAPTIYKSPMLVFGQEKIGEAKQHLNAVAQIFCRLNDTAEDATQLEPATTKVEDSVLRLYEALCGGGEQPKEDYLPEVNKISFDPMENVGRGIQALVEGTSLGGDSGQRLLSNLVHAQLVENGTFASQSVVDKLKGQRRLYAEGVKEHENEINRARKKYQVHGSISNDPKTTTPRYYQLQQEEGLWRRESEGGTPPPFIVPSRENEVVSGGRFGRRPELGLPAEADNGMVHTILDHLSTRLQAALVEKVNGPNSKEKTTFVPEKLNAYIQGLVKNKTPLEQAKSLQQFAVLLLAAFPELGRVTLDVNSKKKRSYAVSPFLMNLSYLQGKLEHLETYDSKNKGGTAVQGVCDQLKVLIRGGLEAKYCSPTTTPAPSVVSSQNPIRIDSAAHPDKLKVDCKFLIDGWLKTQTELDPRKAKMADMILHSFGTEQVLDLSSFGDLDSWPDCFGGGFNELEAVYLPASWRNGETTLPISLKRLLNLEESSSNTLPPKRSVPRHCFGPPTKEEHVGTKGLKRLSAADLLGLKDELDDLNVSKELKEKIFDVVRQGEHGTQLNLSNKKLTALPDVLFDYLPHLTELNLSDNNLTSLPSSLKGLENLKVLNLAGNTSLSAGKVLNGTPEMNGTFTHPDGRVDEGERSAIFGLGGAVHFVKGRQTLANGQVQSGTWAYSESDRKMVFTPSKSGSSSPQNTPLNVDGEGAPASENGVVRQKIKSDDAITNPGTTSTHNAEGKPYINNWDFLSIYTPPTRKTEPKRG